VDAQNTRVLPYGDDAIAEAARLILAGQPVAVPTETVYGLAADATNGEAVARIYEAKGRPSFNPLIVHVDLAEAELLAPSTIRRGRWRRLSGLGPLTLVLPLREDSGIAALVTAGLPTIALRCPAHPAMRAFSPPPAGRSPRLRPMPAADQPDPRRACPRQPRRPDPADRRRRPDRARARIDHRRGGGGGRQTVAAGADKPGRHRSRTSPSLEGRGRGWVRRRRPKLRVRSSLAALAYPPPAPPFQGADAQPRPRIAVAPVPSDGIGLAINDRLRRAAAPRDKD
jgi:L-threonylcarbamoyladenylate synthase